VSQYKQVTALFTPNIIIEGREETDPVRSHLHKAGQKNRQKYLTKKNQTSIVNT
jgi:hypothetical protein